MAAYAAVISLKHTINALLNPISASSSFASILIKIFQFILAIKHTINGLLNYSPITLSISYSTLEMLQSAYNESTSLQRALERLNDSSSRKRVDGVDGQIRDAAHKLEDVLEFHEFNLEEEEVRKEIMSFIEAAKKMEKEYIQELSKPLTEEEEKEENDAALVVDFGVEMVGHSTLFNTIREELLEKMSPIDSLSISIVGENGSGRTAFANDFYEEVGELYECCAWVTLGDKQLKEVVIRILDQVGNNEAASLLLESGEGEEDEEMICKQLSKALEHRRYMIVLDDVRSSVAFQCLRSSFPDDPSNQGSALLVTTNQQEIAQLADCPASLIHDNFIQTMWVIARMFIFCNKHVSPELEEAGKKIIDNCRRRYISFYKALFFLYKTEKTVEEWNKIAEDKEHPIFMVGDEISEVNEIKRDVQLYNTKMDDTASDFIVECISGMSAHIIKGFKKLMHPERFYSKMEIICLVGMPGIGKTTFAKKLIQDELILSHFDNCAWVNIGPKYQAEEILIDILAQIYLNIDKMDMKEDEELVRELCVQVSSKRCLIVLEDLWSKDPLHHLKNQFPDIKGITLVTTTRADVAKFGEDDFEYEIPLLDEEESWCLLCKKVFGGEDCPPELEKAGRKIAENCEGLPLLILTVAHELLQVARSEECWNNVASGKEKSVFMNAHCQISKALLPRYQSLPQHLKICFLYIGVFRQKYKIPTSGFTNLFIAEGFLELNKQQTMEEYVAECMSELVQRSLVMVQRKAVPISEFKTCRLHAVFWHLANTQAMKNKFFHAMNCYDDCSIESMKMQRRLCIRNSVLLGFKDVQKSMVSATSAHSLLCVSPLQQYPVPINFDMKLLRVMNAITIRHYEFPIEVVRLLLLIYLGLTFNGKLPSSISNLGKLKYLIVKRHTNIKSLESCCPLPEEIWDMKELKHLQITGGRLPNPNPNCGAGLPKLTTLLDVSAQSCTQKVLEMIPNLKRLGIRIELAPDDDELLGDSLGCLNNICGLSGLESLKCAVVNPQIRPGVIPSLIMLPPNLKRLSLSGMGYPWEYMNSMTDAGNLWDLEVLKLKHYAFQGPKWEFMDPTIHFHKLKYLLVEDANLVQWKQNLPVSPCLEHLCFKHCYKLKELPIPMNIYPVKNIEIVECSPFTVTWAEQTAAQLRDCKVKVHPLGVPHTHRE